MPRCFWRCFAFSMGWPMSDHVRLSAAFGVLADDALLNNRAPPVIETDLFSAVRLAELVCRDIGCGAGDLMPGPSSEYVLMFDGVKIVARRPQICKHQVDEWRDHFGALAAIWSD